MFAVLDDVVLTRVYGYNGKFAYYKTSQNILFDFKSNEFPKKHKFQYVYK